MGSLLKTIERLQRQVSDLEAQLAAVQQGVQAAVPLPLLLRDIARDLGITVPQACIALKPLGNYSTNSAVTAEMAKLLRDSFPAPAHPAEGVQPIAKELADMLERSITGLGHYRDTANWSEADEEHINECNALLDRFACIDEATHPTQQGLDAQTEAARSVLAERARQIAAEGYTPEQDDGYNPGVLALHGGLYACHAYDNLTKKRAPEGWQWDAKWWKSKDPRSNLVKAGALILAEIERMDRSFAAQAKQGEQANG